MNRGRPAFTIILLFVCLAFGLLAGGCGTADTSAKGPAAVDRETPREPSSPAAESPKSHTMRAESIQPAQMASEDTGPASPPPAGSRALVTAVDFMPLGNTGRTRLAIRTDYQVTPQISTRDDGGTVVLSLTPARIPSRLTRPLDTTYFRSPVNYIKPAQGAGGRVELYVRLRQVVPYHLGQEGRMTFMDFDPSDVPPPQAVLPRKPVEPGPPPAKSGEAKPMIAGQEKTAESTESVLEKMGYTSLTGPKKYAGARISLDFQNADIHNILRIIGDVSGKNVVVSDKVAGKVTLRLKEVPWDQALDIVLAANQLGVVQRGNVLRIDKLELLKAEKNAIIDEIKKEQEIAVAPAALSKKVFTPKYASVDSMKEVLEKLLPAADKRREGTSLAIIGNDIYVTAEAEIISQMAEVFEKNDKVARQILIESRIVEASTSFTKSLGVNWGGNVSGRFGGEGELFNLYGAVPGAAISSPPSGTAGVGVTSVGPWGGRGGMGVNLVDPVQYGMGIGFGVLTDWFSLDAKLYAMEETGEGRIVSAPRILAQNDQEVYIKQGQSIPYQTVSSEGTKTEFRDATLMLSVKPHIEKNGQIITMDITVTKDSPDYSRGANNPPINKREAKTKLMVKDGETVVIGGIIVDNKGRSIKRVPGLHSIPIIGWLFKSRAIEDSKTELVIFLSSHIIPVKL
ncbi:MAG: type IV pilus secretin PilQ [Proteobacteria bacterium]|nr:type IV pilus secretin PilQ [Pseudomonadota bacterium]